VPSTANDHHGGLGSVGTDGGGSAAELPSSVAGLPEGVPVAEDSSCEAGQAGKPFCIVQGRVKGCETEGFTMRSLLLTLVLVFAAALVPGCSQIDRLTKSVDSAIAQLERGVNNFQDIKAILEDTKEKLDKEKYKNQVDELAGRTSEVAQIGVEGTLDFTRQRVIDDLRNMKREILGQPLLPRLPVLTNCQSAKVDLTSPSRTSLTFVGWNLDVVQQIAMKNEYRPYKVVIKNAKGADRNIDWKWVTFQGQYAVTIDVSSSGVLLQHYDNKIVFEGLDPAFEIAIVNSNPPPLPRLTGARVTITSVTDKPKKGQITLKLFTANGQYLYQQNGAISLWLKEEWAPGTEHRYDITCDIPVTPELKINFMFKGEGPAGGEFAGQRINWTGRAKIELFFNGKATPLLLHETENKSWNGDQPEGFPDGGEHFAVYQWTVPDVPK
jgi:hypothetical protein